MTEGHEGNKEGDNTSRWWQHNDHTESDLESDKADMLELTERKPVKVEKRGKDFNDTEIIPKDTTVHVAELGHVRHGETITLEPHYKVNLFGEPILDDQGLVVPCAETNATVSIVRPKFGIGGTRVTVVCNSNRRNKSD